MSYHLHHIVSSFISHLLHILTFSYVIKGLLKMFNLRPVRFTPSDAQLWEFGDVYVRYRLAPSPVTQPLPRASRTPPTHPGIHCIPLSPQLVFVRTRYLYLQCVAYWSGAFPTAQRTGISVCKILYISSGSF